MFEGSARVVEAALKQFELGGLNVPQLTSGLRLSQRQANRGFADWNELAIVFERAKEATGGDARLQELCETSIPRALPEAVALMQLAPDLVQGIQLINTFADSTFFTNVRYPQMRRRGERTLEAVMSIPQRRGYRDSPAFFEAMGGVFRASSLFAGHAPATVRCHVQPYSASYQITLPELEHQMLDDTERQLRRSLFDHWQGSLRGLRHELLELRQREIESLESATFSVLSAVVSTTLAARELTAMPMAAAAAIRDTLGCTRVVLRKSSSSGGRGLVLAECGASANRLTSFEAEAQGGLLTVLADVTRGSAAGKALQGLTPWLALVLGASPPARADLSQSNREAERLSELALSWGLTSRQAQVAWLMIQGESNKGIASILGCAEGTVELHVHAVLGKSGVPGRAALAKHFYSP